MWGINMCVMCVYDSWAHDTLEQLHCLYEGITSWPDHLDWEHFESQIMLKWNTDQQSSFLNQNRNRHMHPNVYHSTVYNSQDMEAT